MFKSLLSLLVLFAFFQECSSQSVLSHQVDSLFADIQPETPGAAITIVRNGKVVLSKGYGSANLEHGIPITTTTVFDIASVSKQFTAFAMLLLENDGRLSLDDDVHTYIPELPDYGMPITLRHLATHTNGLREYIQLLRIAGWRLDGDVIAQEHVLELILKQQALNFEPGTEFSYSNSGYALLSEVVERVSGQSFAEYCNDHIFEPLGMKHTQIYADEERIVPRQASAYYATDASYKKVNQHVANQGAGGVFTTTDDIALWMINFDQMIVGNAGLFEVMNSPMILANGDTLSAAMGQFLMTHRGISYIQHSGGGIGFNAFLGRFPDQDFSIAVMSNDDDFSAQLKALEVVDVLLADHLSDHETSERIDDPFTRIDPEDLKQFEAHYWSDTASMARSITLQNDSLWYVRSAGNESPLTQISDQSFTFADALLDVAVSFGIDETGKKTMTYQLNADPPVLFTEYQPVDGSRVDLTPFEGMYYSSEVDAVYHLRIKEGQLVADHLRVSDVTLNPVMEDLFSGDRYAFSQVRFERDEDQAITGFRVSNPQFKRLYFKKIDL